MWISYVLYRSAVNIALHRAGHFNFTHFTFKSWNGLVWFVSSYLHAMQSVVKVFLSERMKIASIWEMERQSTEAISKANRVVKIKNKKVKYKCKVCIHILLIFFSNISNTAYHHMCLNLLHFIASTAINDTYFLVYLLTTRCNTVRYICIHRRRIPTEFIQENWYSGICNHTNQRIWLHVIPHETVCWLFFIIPGITFQVKMEISRDR